jgi:predicted RNA binding protein YcfA (HicA-like mRNA interferase family)
MSGLRPLPFRKVSRALIALGFQPIRQVGSHVTIAHADGRKVVVPNHADTDVGRGLLRAILRQVGLTWVEFERLL